jgi:hypothetical protein
MCGAGNGSRGGDLCPSWSSTLLGILGRATAFRETQSSHCGVNLTRLLIWIEISIKYSDLKVIVVRMHYQPITPIA